MNAHELLQLMLAGHRLHITDEGYRINDQTVTDEVFRQLALTDHMMRISDHAYVLTHEGARYARTLKLFGKVKDDWQ